MKILHLIYDHIKNPWVGGGGAVRVYEIYKRFSSRNRITVVCGRYPACEDYSVGNLNYIFIGSERNSYIYSVISYVVQAASFLKRYADEYDVVIEDFAPYNPLFSFLRHKKAIIQLHQKEGVQLIKKNLFLGPVFFSVEFFYPKLFRRAVFVSEVCRDKFLSGGEVTVIPNGLDLKLLAEETEDGEYVLFLGRLDIRQKGLDTLSDALTLLNKDLRIVIAGHGRHEPKVRKIFAGHIDSGAAIMAGFVEGEIKAAYLKKCKFVIVPSRFEAQCITVLEAAGFGKPVIVSDIPELSYSVNAGFGLSFKTDDAEDLACKIKLLSGDESLRMDMGRRAREFAKEYSWEKIALSFERYLSDVLHRA